MADLSWSQISNWLTCGERFRLERVEKTPTPPTWPLVGGRAVHTATEEIDKSAWDMKPDDPGVKARWSATFMETVNHAADTDETGTPIERWRTSRDHGLEWWAENGAPQVAAWLRTRQEKGWRLFADDPDLGIEAYVDGWYGDNRIRGYIDRLLMTEDGEPFVLDLKTGEKPPQFPMQLGIYADLLRRGPLQVDVAGGVYFMSLKGELTPMLDLSGFTTELISRYTDKLGDDLETGDFLPNPGWLCSTCAVRPQCSVGSLLYLPPPKGRKTVIKPLTAKKQEEGKQNAVAQV